MNEQVVKMVADIAEDEKMNYYGMTHLPISPKLYKWWRKVFCRHGIHLFDEVMGTGKGDEWDHYLVCDACQLMVNIKSVDQTYVKRKYKSKGYYK